MIKASQITVINYSSWKVDSFLTLAQCYYAISLDGEFTLNSLPACTSVFFPMKIYPSHKAMQCNTNLISINDRLVLHLCEHKDGILKLGVSSFGNYGHIT